MKKLPLILSVAVLALLLALPPMLKNYGVYLFTTWLVFVIATMGLNLTVGYAGQKSLGHAAFFGIGAYTVAILMKAGVSFWLGLPLAMAGCFVIGLGLGFPALRVQTIYLAFATLGFNTAVWLVMRNEEWRRCKRQCQKKPRARVTFAPRSPPSGSGPWWQSRTPARW